MTFRILVTRIGTDDPPLHDETFTGTALEAEKRAMEIWNGPYCMQPGRFRLHLREGSTKRGPLVQTID